VLDDGLNRPVPEQPHADDQPHRQLRGKLASSNRSGPGLEKRGTDPIRIHRASKLFERGEIGTILKTFDKRFELHATTLPGDRCTLILSTNDFKRKGVK
jgi:hypothetical protein